MLKKFLLSILVLSSFSVSATDYDDNIKPKMPSDYVAQDRFVSTDMRGNLEYIITDTKTGCQYIVVNSGASARPATLLGCFEEYKKK